MKTMMKAGPFDFNKCRKCIYFPDISVETHPYYVDKYGVKHRDIKYICQYDLHEIKVSQNECPKGEEAINARF